MEVYRLGAEGEDVDGGGAPTGGMGGGLVFGGGWV